MPKKVVLIVDPGIDTAFAVALALHDPELDVVGLVATAGNVSSEQATKNVHILINHLDPRKWPRLGGALPIDYEMNGLALHGPGGLGGVQFSISTLHPPIPGDKVLVELVREHPHDITIICLGPLTVLSQALIRDPELPRLVQKIVILGGSRSEPGNAGPVSEFHFACDPPAARAVLQSGASMLLIPLDVMRKVVFSPRDLLELPNPESNTSRFLRQIVPHGIRATSNLYGIEGFHLKDVLGVIALSVPSVLDAEPEFVDVEIRGELTRGMSVFDRRPGNRHRPNVLAATGVDLAIVRSYINSILRVAP